MRPKTGRGLGMRPKTEQGLGMRPKTEWGLRMRPKTERGLGMRPKEQYPGYEEKAFLLIWMIPFYFHVVVESVHEKQLILLSDVLCQWSTTVRFSLVPGPHHCLVFDCLQNAKWKEKIPSFFNPFLHKFCKRLPSFPSSPH